MLPWADHQASLSDLERFYLLLCFGPGLAEGGVGAAASEADLERLFELADVGQEQAAFLRQQDRARLFIYRRLVRSNLERAVGVALPRTRARLGERFSQVLSAFFDESAPSTRFLRDVTGAYLDFLATQLPPEEDYLVELGRLEAVRIDVAAQPAETRPTFELDLARGLVLAESTRVLSFAHAVHELPESEADRSLPPARPTHLLVYRDAETTVRYLELSATAAAMLRHLLEGMALGEAVTAGCAETGEHLTEAVLGGTAKLLSDLAQRGVVLGASD